MEARLEAIENHPAVQATVQLVSPAVVEQTPLLRAKFESARPFKHLVIEGFLKTDVAEALLRDFPAFDPKRAVNEFGEVGNKAVNEKIETLSASYAAVADYLKSAVFLKLMSDLTGIPDLLPDVNMFGGGTHENRHGQELDAHVDFNYDPQTKLHRRLNLLVYLNREWDESWGGSIELHSNPRKPDENEISSFTPLLNRAVIFETNEYSWHGFQRIDLPADRRQLSRKSLSVYLYTKTRPEHEIVPEHGTFYVQRPLPSRVQPGRALTAADVEEIKRLLAQRDGWIEHYQRVELQVSSQMGEFHQRIRQLEDQCRELGGEKKSIARSVRRRVNRLLGRAQNRP
ncbi:MAG TPA: 2OG-Fe(II) oxygenase [Roseiarcus sp.]|jgi:Rps23 Pro-64 3,4-dihydroxylase Tpa1-like proline 4-hydroxylase